MSAQRRSATTTKQETATVPPASGRPRSRASIAQAASAAQAAPAAPADTAAAPAPEPAPRPNRGADRPAKDAAAPARRSVIAERIGGARRLYDDTRSEMRKINWPDQKTTKDLTVVVIGISIALGLLLGGIDWVLFQLFELTS